MNTASKAMLAVVVLVGIVGMSLRRTAYAHSAGPGTVSANPQVQHAPGQYICVMHGRTKLCSALEIGTTKDDVVLALGVGQEQQETFENGTVSWLRYDKGTLLMFENDRLAAISTK